MMFKSLVSCSDKTGDKEQYGANLTELSGLLCPRVHASWRQSSDFSVKFFYQTQGGAGARSVTSPALHMFRVNRGIQCNGLLAFLITILFTEGDQRDKCCDVISILALSALSALQSAINIAADHRFHLGSPDYEICI